ncbi:hypothetical protein ILFOPFJJ_06672 [Ensifer psoraleae]|nr:hypothetical protein [Sinorhizobium psoraleae]
MVVADIDGSAAIACTAQIAAEAGHALALAMDIADAQAVTARRCLATRGMPMRIVMDGCAVG